MALLYGVCDLLLKILWKFIIAVELAGLALNVLFDVGYLPGGHTTPTGG